MARWTSAELDKSKKRAGATQPAQPTTDTAQPAKGPPAPRTAAQIAKEQAARRAVVGVGRLAWDNTTFGVRLPCRKFLLASTEQAAVLDAVFWHLTGTAPEGPQLPRPELLRALEGLGA